MAVELVLLGDDWVPLDLSGLDTIRALTIRVLRTERTDSTHVYVRGIVPPVKGEDTLAIEIGGEYYVRGAIYGYSAGVLEFRGDGNTPGETVVLVEVDYTQPHTR
jgi:hypothetical protein